MSNISTVGGRIAQARRELGVRRQQDVSPADLAKEVGVSAAAVYNWEGDEKAPNEKSLERLAEVLEVSRAYLRYGEGPKQPELDLGITTGELREREQGKASAAKKRRPKRA